MFTQTPLFCSRVLFGPSGFIGWARSTFAPGWWPWTSVPGGLTRSWDTKHGP